MNEQSHEQEVPNLNPSHLAPPRGQIDGTCAGIPLDAWRRGDPLDEVQTAIRFLVDHPDQQIMAYCHDVSVKEWQTHDNRQKAAGKAWATREYPHLNIRLRTETMAYYGVGNDVTVVFAEIVKPKKVAA